MFKFICTSITKPRIATSCMKLNQPKKNSHQQASTSKINVDENQDEDNEGKRETPNRAPDPFPLVFKLPSFRQTVQPASNLKMKQMPRFYTGNFLIVDSPKLSISKKYFHLYSISLSKRLFSSMYSNKRFVNDASRENYRQEMEQLSSIQKTKCDFQFKPLNDSVKTGASPAESWMKRTKKKTYKTGISYPTHTVKHNLTLSKRYRIREGSVENKIKELEAKYKQQKKVKSKMFKTKRITYPTLMEHVMERGKFNTISVDSRVPEKPPFQWQSLGELKIEVMKHEPQEEECHEPLVSEALEAEEIDEQVQGLIRSHPQIEYANKEVKMKLKGKFMQLLMNPATKRRALPFRTETNEETVKKSTKSENLKSCEAEEMDEEKYPVEVEENEQATKEEKENITTHPQKCHAREVIEFEDIRRANNSVTVDDDNTFDVDEICIKETATKIGSGLISRAYAKEPPKPNYKKLHEEAQKVPNRVLKQTSAKCKPIRENSKPNYQQIEQEAKDLSNFIGKMKISHYKSDSNFELKKTEAPNKNSDNKLVEHLMDLKEMQELTSNSNENTDNNNQSPKITYGHPKQKVNHPNESAVMLANKIKQETTTMKNNDLKIINPEKILDETSPPPKQLIVDELMKNQIKITEPNVDPRFLTQPLEEGTEVDELNEKAKAAEKKFIRRKVKKEQQKHRNDVKDKTSDLKIKTRYDKSEAHLEEKVEIAEKFKKKIQELELVLDREEVKAPKSTAVRKRKLGKQEPTTKYDEINKVAEKLIKKRKKHQPVGQRFIVGQLNSKLESKENTSKIEENEFIDNGKDKRVMDRSYRREKHEPDPCETQILIMPETEEKNTFNVGDIALYPEPLEEKIDDHLTKMVTPQTIHPVVIRQGNMIEKLVVDDIKDIKNNDVVLGEPSIDEGVLLKPGDEIVILECNTDQLMDSESTFIDSEGYQDTRNKMDMVLRKIGELKEIIKRNHIEKRTENMPRIPPPKYRPQKDKVKKNKHIKGDPKPEDKRDMILPPKKVPASEAISNDEVGEKPVSGNIALASQLLDVKSVSSNVLINSLSGNMNKLPKLADESIVKEYLMETDNLKVDDNLLKDNGYFFNKINGPSEPVEPMSDAILSEEGILQEIDAGHQEKIQKYFKTNKFGEDSSLSSSTVNVLQEDDAEHREKVQEYFKTKFGEDSRLSSSTVDDLQEVDAEHREKIQEYFKTKYGENSSLSSNTVKVSNTIMESIPKNTKTKQVVAAQEPQMNTKTMYSKVDTSISETPSSQNPINRNIINPIWGENASTNQVLIQNPSKTATTNQSLTKNARTKQNNAQTASSNQIFAENTSKKASSNPISTKNLQKKVSTNQTTKVSLSQNHARAKNIASTHKNIISCPPAKGKTMMSIMQSYERARSTTRVSCCPLKDIDNTKLGTVESKTKYSSWSKQNFGSDKLERNNSPEATSKVTGSEVGILSRKPNISINLSNNKKSTPDQSDQFQAKSYLTAEASPQNKTSLPMIIMKHSESKMKDSLKNQSLHLLHDAKSNIDKDINMVWSKVKKNFQPEQSEAYLVEDGWVVGLKQLLAVNQEITNKNKQDPNNVTLDTGKLRESKKEDSVVDILQTNVLGAILPENNVDITCLADCNLRQENPIAVLNVTLPKLCLKPFPEGTKKAHQMKLLSGHASEISKAGSLFGQADNENFLRTKTSIVNVTEAKASNRDDKDKKKIFVIKSTTSEPIVKSEDADLTFKIQKLANPKVKVLKINENPYIRDELNEDPEKTILQQREKSVVKAGKDLHEEIMQLNREYASILKGIEQKLTVKRQTLEEKSQEIEQIQAIQKSSKENIAKLGEEIDKAQKFEETKKIQGSLKNIAISKEKFIEVKNAPKVASISRMKQVKNQFTEDLHTLAEDPKNVEICVHPKKCLMDDTVLSTRPQTAQINKTAKVLIERSKTEGTKLRARQGLKLGKNKQLATTKCDQSKTSNGKQKLSLHAIKPTEMYMPKEPLKITTKMMSKEAVESEIETWIINFNKNKRVTSVQSVNEELSKKSAKVSQSEHIKPKKLAEKSEDDATSIGTIISKLHPLIKKPALSRTEIMRKNIKEDIQRSEYRSKLEEKTHRESSRIKKDCVANLNSQANEMVKKEKRLKSAGRHKMHQKDGKLIRSSSGNSSWESSNAEMTGKRSYHKASNISKDFNRLMSKKEYLEYKRLEAEENKKKKLFEAVKKSAVAVATELVIYENKYGEEERQIETEKCKSIAAKILPINRGNSEGLIRKIKTPTSMQIYKKTNQENDLNQLIKNEKELIYGKKINYDLKETIKTVPAKKDSGQKKAMKETEMETYKNDDTSIKTTKVQKTQSGINQIQEGPAQVKPTLELIYTKNIVGPEKHSRNDKRDKILNNTVKKIQTELELARQSLGTAENNKNKENIAKVNAIKLAKSEVRPTNLIKTKKEKLESATTNKTVSKLETNKILSEHQTSRANFNKKIPQELEAKKKLESKVEPPELTADAINFKITKMTKMVIDDMILTKHADIKFLEPAKVDFLSNKDLVNEKKQKSEVIKTIVKSHLKLQVSDSTRNQPHNLHKSVTINLLEKNNSKTAQKNPTTKKEIEKEPKKVIQKLKSTSLGNMIKPKKVNTAVTINMANKDGKNTKKPDPKKDGEEITPTFIFKQKLCKSPKKIQKIRSPPTIRAQKPPKKYGIKIVLPLRNIKEVNKEFFESYQSTLEKPVGDKIKVVPKEILDMEKKKKMAADEFWDQMKYFNANKYKHLRISYMTVKKRPKKKEKFLPNTPEDMEEGKLSEEAKNRIINFRFELLKRLNEEFQKRVNEQGANNTPETSEVKNVIQIDKNANKTMKPIGKTSFFSKIIKGKKNPSEKTDDTKTNPKGSRGYSTNNSNEKDDCSGKTDVNRIISIKSRLAMASSCASDNSSEKEINSEPIEKIQAFDILKAVPNAFEAASPKLEKQRHKNLYYRTHSWTYFTLNEYLHDQRVFSLDAAEKKGLNDCDEKNQEK